MFKFSSAKNNMVIIMYHYTIVYIDPVRKIRWKYNGGLLVSNNLVSPGYLSYFCRCGCVHGRIMVRLNSAEKY